MRIDTYGLYQAVKYQNNMAQRFEEVTKQPELYPAVEHIFSCALGELYPILKHGPKIGQFNLFY